MHSVKQDWEGTQHLFKGVSSERTGSMLREDSKFCSRACNCSLLWWHCSCSWEWISGFRWKINGEKAEIHFVRCCAKHHSLLVVCLREGHCIFLSVSSRLLIWKILSKANCYLTEGTMQNENCHELQHCDSVFHHKLIIFDNYLRIWEYRPVKISLLEIAIYTPEPGDRLWRSSTRTNDFQTPSFPHDLRHCN